MQVRDRSCMSFLRARELTGAAYCAATPAATPKSLWRVLSKRNSCSLASQVFNLEFSPAGDLLLATTENNLVQVLDSRAQRRIRSLQAHQQSVNVCRFWDGNTFVTGSDDCTAKQWDTRMWKCVNHFKGHIGWIKNVEIYDNRTLITSAFDGTLRVWDRLASDGVAQLPTRQGGGPPNLLLYHPSVRRCAVTPRGEAPALAVSLKDCIVVVHNFDPYSAAPAIERERHLMPRPSLTDWMRVLELTGESDADAGGSDAVEAAVDCEDARHGATTAETTAVAARSGGGAMAGGRLTWNSAVTSAHRGSQGASGVPDESWDEISEFMDRLDVFERTGETDVEFLRQVRELQGYDSSSDWEEDEEEEEEEGESDSDNAAPFTTPLSGSHTGTAAAVNSTAATGGAGAGAGAGASASASTGVSSKSTSNDASSDPPALRRPATTAKRLARLRGMGGHQMQRNRVEILAQRSGPATSSMVFDPTGTYLLTRRVDHDHTLSSHFRETCTVFDIRCEPHSDFVPDTASAWVPHGVDRTVFMVSESPAANGYIKEPSWSTDGRYIASPYKAGLRLLDVRSYLADQGGSSAAGMIMAPLETCVLSNAHRAPTLTCRFHPWGGTVVTGSQDGSVNHYAPRY